MKTVQPTPELIAFMDDLKAALGKHTQLDAMQMLAVGSQFVGNLIALQDQRRVTPAMAMELVARNIEIGNAEAIAPLMGKGGKV